MTLKHKYLDTKLAFAGMITLLMCGICNTGINTQSASEAEWQRLQEFSEIASTATRLARSGKPEQALEILGDLVSDTEFIEFRHKTLYTCYLQMGDWENFLRVARTQFEIQSQKRGDQRVLPATRAAFALALHLTGKQTEAWETMRWNPEQYDPSIFTSTLDSSILHIGRNEKSIETQGIDLVIAYLHLVGRVEMQQLGNLRPCLALCEAMIAKHPEDQYLQFWYGRLVYENRDAIVFDGAGNDLALTLLGRASLGPDERYAIEAGKLLTYLKSAIDRERKNE